MLGKCLEKAGYIVRYAENGAQAIESASSEGFSSIILDITMPDMSGFDVLKEFRSRGINTPVERNRRHEAGRIRLYSQAV